MARQPVAPIEALGRIAGNAHFHGHLDQVVGHRVVAPTDGHVVGNVDPGLLPLGIDVALCRQGLQGWPVELLEVVTAPSGQLPEGAGIELLEQFADRRVQFRQGEELAVAHGGQDPALNHQHAVLHFGFVAGLAGPGGQDRHAAVGGHVLVGLMSGS